MRLNAFLSHHTTLSRRGADDAIAAGKVTVNNQPALLGQQVGEADIVKLEGAIIEHTEPIRKTIMLNKPVGYVCSRDGQGSQTIYELLPPDLQNLKPIGRLDKDSSGLLLMTTDGQLLQRLAHPSYQKTKTYQVQLDKPLDPADANTITSKGVDIGDERVSQFTVLTKPHYLEVQLEEGRNRQIRRTFAALGYQVTRLHREAFGAYKLENLAPGAWREIETTSDK